jgi:hypothetical protein
VNVSQLLGVLTCDGERKMREISILLPQNGREGQKNIEIITMYGGTICVLNRPFLIGFGLGCVATSSRKTNGVVASVVAS